MLEASNLKTMESWYQNLSPYVNDKEFPLRGGKKDLPPVLIGLSQDTKGVVAFETSTRLCSKVAKVAIFVQLESIW